MLKRNKPINMLEIGIKDPRFPYASVKIWDLFFKNPNIIGLDINDSKELENLIPNFTYKYLDQYSELSHKNLVSEFEDKKMSFDYIIDDGPHYFDAQLKSFNYLFKFVKKGGFYIVEDLHVDRSFIDYIKNLNIDYNLYCNDKLMIIPNK
jgi:demethylmacrocin O-methyltransferase